MIPRYQLRLSDLARYRTYARCYLCRYEAEIDPLPLISAYGENEFAKRLEPKLRCTKCGGPGYFRVDWTTARE